MILVQEYLLLLRTSLKIWFSSTFKSKSKKKIIGTIFAYLALLAFAVFWTILSANLFKDLIALFPAGSEIFIEKSILTVAQLLALGTILFLFLTGLRILYEYLYESQDVSFLLATPLQVENIFAAKLTECLGLIFLSISFMTLTPFIGLGIAFKAGFFYYLSTIISFLAGFVIFGSIAALLLLLIMRFVPGQKLKQILMSLTLIMGLVIVFVSQMFSSNMMNMTEEDIINALSGFSDLGINKMSFLPHVWMAKSSVATLPNSQINFWANFIPLVVISALVFWFTTKLSAKLYLSGWSSGQETDSPKKKRAKSNAKNKEEKRLSRVGSPFGAMLKKEMLYLKREPMMWYQIAVGLIVLGFFAFNNARIQSQSGVTGSIPPDFINQSVNLFMILLFAGLSGPTVAGLALSREGKNWRFMQSLPVEPRTVYWSKFIFGYLPCLLEGLIGVAVFHYIKIVMFPLYITIPTIAISLAALISVDLWTDIYFPNFNIKIGSSKSQEGAGKILLVNLAMMPIILLLGATFSFQWWYSKVGIFSALSPEVAKAIGLGVFAFETIGVFIISSTTSINRLKLLFTGAVDAKGA